MLSQAYYILPKTYRTLSQDFADYQLSQTEAKIFEKFYGLKQIPYSELRVKDLLAKALKGLIQAQQIDPKQVIGLIHAHTAKVIAPFGYSVIQELKSQFNLNQALAFATTLHNCASTFHALIIAQHLLKHQASEKKVIIMVGEKPLLRVCK